MAKKITFKKEVDVSQMVDILRSEKIEHVRVTYPEDSRGRKHDYIVVKNCYKDLARAKCGDNNILRIKNARHYENICLNHIDDYFEPKFTCTCRHCGKSFKSKVKEAVWCSDKCRNEFRKTKKTA